MNRILLQQDEISRAGCAVLSGRRARHIVNVLKSQPGDLLRIGIINGPRGQGQVTALTPDSIQLTCTFEPSPPPASGISLLLALPRPKVMRRLWAPLASLGVDHIILTNADKVERNYFATHWLNEQTYRPLLIEGVEQSGDTRLPKVSILRRFKPFIEDQLDKEFGQAHKLLLHPRNARPLYDTAFRKGAHVLVAIGPEGGWSDYEVDILVSHGFECVAHGWRILRSDVACIATISSVSLLMENN